ncbi:hypothetical protein AB0N05_37665 [Nocardia sp. NPDC051030]|uniref:hypothetical protein n=1 Tax=Nocardia sp. NPDC051030 TaxID=3155162 RepID=UPI00341F1D48
MSTTGNPPDIDTRLRIFQIAGHPDVEYTVTLVKPEGRGADAWMLAEVTLRSTGVGPITEDDLVSVEHLREAALQGLQELEGPGSQTPSVAMRELAWLPPRCQRALHHRGITTNADLFALSQAQLREMRGIGDQAIKVIEAGRARFSSHRRTLEAS